MTSGELEELLADCPTLFRMAERGSWPSIETHGLLSASALLDLYGIDGDARDANESERRPSGVTLDRPNLGRATIRDQAPMDDAGLARCLEDGLTPRDWYRLLNAKVFFWLSRDRLRRLLHAKPYRRSEHDVLEIDAASLVRAHRDRIWLCPINSGCARPFPQRRGAGTFRRIADYPYSHWRAKRPRGERAVELAVDHAVPDIASQVTRVVRMRSDEEIAVLAQRGPHR